MSPIGSGFTFAPSKREKTERKTKEEHKKTKKRGRENVLSFETEKSFRSLFFFRRIKMKKVKMDGIKRET